jgi:hypothetical protein
LGVVTLIEAAAGDLHDARVFIRQIHLLLVFHGAGRRFGPSAARLLAGALLLVGAGASWA